MQFRTFTRLAAVALTVAAAASATASAQDTNLLGTVRDATAMYRDVNLATRDGWLPGTGCVSGPQEGAMGTHYINGDLVFDGELNPRKPEALIYEHKNGRATLVGVEFLVIADAWNAKHSTPPVLLGQHFQFNGTPNRYGLPAFYELHVWAWKENPFGTFVDWHQHVSCDDVQVK